MKQIVTYKVFLSNEIDFLKTQPTHVFERRFDVDVNNPSNDVLTQKSYFDSHVRNFVNGCREVFSQVYVDKSVDTIDFDFDLV